ncbi:MAG TPA: hypothetical protein VFP22_07645 [Candidatus Limnocylindrales bacterium]|nr:hypothetical protein [Candidatus Limnocylindrales bacterium]
MSEAHQIVGDVAFAATIVLVVAAGWSLLAARRTGAQRDHRFAVDRAVLLLVAVVAANVLLGAVLFATGSRPADGLHLLYGAVALVAVPVGWAVGGRGGSRSRLRRDAWVGVAALLLIGIEIRLFMTG